MNKNQFRAFLDLMMCSDPWPIDGEEGEKAHKLLIDLANEESQKYRMDNWIVAYHEIESL